MVFVGSVMGEDFFFMTRNSFPSWSVHAHNLQHHLCTTLHNTLVVSSTHDNVSSIAHVLLVGAGIYGKLNQHILLTDTTAINTLASLSMN